MSYQTLIYVTNICEYEKTRLLYSIDISFNYTMPACGKEEQITLKGSNNDSSVRDNLSRIFEKMKFAISDGITMEPNVKIESKGFKLSNTPSDNVPASIVELFYVHITFSFKYEKHPNFYKLKEDGLIPCCPEYDKHMLEYLFCHSFEPTINMVKLDYDHIKLEQ